MAMLEPTGGEFEKSPILRRHLTVLRSRGGGPGIVSPEVCPPMVDATAASKHPDKSTSTIRITRKSQMLCTQHECRLLGASGIWCNGKQGS